MTTRYLLLSGPDTSHLIDAQYHRLRRDAVSAVAQLPPTPYGNPRPAVILRVKYLESKPWGDKVEDVRVVWHQSLTYSELQAIEKIVCTPHNCMYN